MFDSALVWFRRDLRTDDHVALSEALRRASRVFCCFVFDREILDSLSDKADRRVDFIHQSLVELDDALRQRGGSLIVRHGFPKDEIPRLASELAVTSVFANRDYEPQAKRRDQHVAKRLQQAGIGFESFKDQVIFDGAEVLTQAGRPYTVFTPYKNAWLKRLGEDDYQASSTTTTSGGVLVPPRFTSAMPSLDQIGFMSSGLAQIGVEPGTRGARQLIARFERDGLAHYAAQRDFPAIDGGSRLSVHLRFGTISIRELVRVALARGAMRKVEGAEGVDSAATWLSELIWRDFYFMILDQFPHVTTSAFKRDFDAVNWHEGPLADRWFTAWSKGQTGYPLVDAAMRQLNTTGYMHNRLRMVVASFLTKDLGVDWRRGEAYFAEKLIDFDLAANNGGWQWAASTGCDAQPWFRIFNPVTQSKRFDPQGTFIRRYVPELAGVPERYIHAPWESGAAQQADLVDQAHAERALDVDGSTLNEVDTEGQRDQRCYPAPIVDHAKAREQTLARYAVVRTSAGE